MTVSINGRYSHNYIQGVLIKEALSPADETINRGHFAATTLSAVDGDLAVGNIKDGVTIFGFLGTLAGGPLSEDVIGTAGTTLAGVSPVTLNSLLFGVLAGSDGDVASKALTFAANSLAVAVGVCTGKSGLANMFKLRLYMGGVQVAESPYWDLDVVECKRLIATRALSGSQTSKVALHNYNGSDRNFYLYTIATSGKGASAIGVGSIKL